MTLKNKHAVVTGGGSGVGEAIALKLAENSKGLNIKIFAYCSFISISWSC